METFGERLRRLRTAKRIWIADFASMVPCATSAVSQWENNQRKPRFSYLPRLAELLGVTVDYLVAGAEDERITALHRALRNGTPNQQVAALRSAVLAVDLPRSALVRVVRDDL